MYGNIKILYVSMAIEKPLSAQPVNENSQYILA